MTQRAPFVSNSNIHNLLCWIPNCKYFFCYVYICLSLVYLNYSLHILSMTVRNVNLCSYISNSHVYAYLRLLIKVVHYLITQIVFSAAQLLVSITYVFDYFISTQMFLPYI